MSSEIVRAFVLVASVAFVACGETTDLVESELSETEAEALASMLLFATFNSTGDVPAAVAGGPQAAPFEFSDEVDGTVQCPLGGSVAYEAAIDVSGDTESEAGSIDYSMTQVHQGCGVMSESETQFTLTGAPSLTLEFLVENNGQGVTEWGGLVEGAVEWVSAGRTGTCAASFEFGGRREAEVSVTGELAGSVCGHSVQRTFSIGG